MHHLVNLDDNSLAKQMLNTQKMYSFPGLVSEVKNLTKEFDLEDITKEEIATELSKQRWKSKVKKKIRQSFSVKLKNNIIN